MTINIYDKLSEERKKLQEDGLVPEWYSTGGYQLFKEKYDYQTDGRSVRGQFERIAKTAAKHLKGTSFMDDAEQQFFDLFWNGYLSPSTPVLANMGTDRGLPVSCSGSVVGDSIHGFYSNRLETAMLTKMGFGTSGYLGDIRPRGAGIACGGKASGVVPVFKGHVQDMRDVAQGTARRGAWAGYLEIDHGDFDELADLVMSEPDDANVGWIISNAFIDLLEAKDPEADRRFKKTMKVKMVTGKGYYCFIDKVNANRPEMYKRLGLEVKSSNLCVRGNTIINIECDGVFENIRIDDFCEKYGFGMYSNAKVKTHKDGIDFYAWISAAGITGKSKELIRIETPGGNVIECTLDHLIFTKNRGLVIAGELNEDDELLECSLL